MSKILTPAEAAAEIRPEYDLNLGHDIPPETRHEHAYISEVCAALGVEASHAAIAHVRNLLVKHDIQPHAMQEYPKWIHRGDKEHPVLVNSKEDEANLGAEPKPVFKDPNKVPDSMQTRPAPLPAINADLAKTIDAEFDAKFTDKTEPKKGASR